MRNEGGVYDINSWNCPSSRSFLRRGLRLETDRDKWGFCVPTSCHRFLRLKLRTHLLIFKKKKKKKKNTILC